MKNVLTLLIKSVLLPLELKTTTSEIDAAIQNKIYGPGITTQKSQTKKWNISWKSLNTVKNLVLWIGEGKGETMATLGASFLGIW